MKALALTAALLLIPAVAPAQTKTSCGMELGRYVCHTMPEQGPTYGAGIVQQGAAAFDQAYVQLERLRQDREAYQNARAAAASQTADEALALEGRRVEAIDIVKRYIAAGQCEDAKRIAYEYFGTKGEYDAAALCK